jgi:hypothetical protein
MLFGIDFCLGSEGSHDLGTGDKIEVEDEVLFNECECFCL